MKEKLVHRMLMTAREEEAMVKTAVMALTMVVAVEEDKRVMIATIADQK